jgi:hypothetical protein
MAGPDRLPTISECTAVRSFSAGKPRFLAAANRTQDSLFMSWPNMLPQGGPEVVLFYIND